MAKLFNISRIAFFVLACISLMIYPILNNIHPGSNILKIPFIDDFIPFWSLFIIPYILYIPYLIFGTVYFTFFSKNYIWFVLSLVGIEIISGLTFYFYQTHVPRPEVIGNDILSDLVRLTYSIDKPYNCFPSTHASLTILYTFFFAKENLFLRNSIAKYSLYVFGFLAIISTVFVKQHYIVDVFGGVGLAVLMIYLSHLTLKKLETKFTSLNLS